MSNLLKLLLLFNSLTVQAQFENNDWNQKIYHEDSGYRREILEQRVISLSQADVLKLEKNCNQTGGTPIYDSRYSANCYKSGGNLITCGCTVHFECHFKKKVDYAPKDPTNIKPFESFFGRYKVVRKKCMKNDLEYDPVGKLDFIDLGYINNLFVVLLTPHNSPIERIEGIAKAPLPLIGSNEYIEYENVEKIDEPSMEIHTGIVLEKITDIPGIDVALKTHRNSYSATYNRWTNFNCLYGLKK